MRIKTKANRAIVRLPKCGGHGVLVQGGFILTAAHCIDFATTGGMVLGDHYIEEIEAHNGKIKASPLAIEPMCDIAALGCPDGQVFHDEAEAFENFCEMIKPIPLAKTPIKCRRPFSVRVHDKDGSWINGVAEIFDESSPMLWVTTDQEIKGGASGGPILNLVGELVAIVSNSSSPVEGKSNGRCPRPLQALPAWLVQSLAQTRRGMDEKTRPIIEKIQNKPLNSLDQQNLQSSIANHILMVICTNFDHFFPEADAQQIEMNVHSAHVTARALAERAMELIGKSYTPLAGFEPQHPPRLRDLGVILGNAATESVLTLSASDGRKNLKVGEIPSFVTAIMRCADRILVDALIEAEDRQ